MMFEEVEINSERWLSLEDLLNEEWKDIKGYEGHYQVSNYGRIKSFAINKGMYVKILKYVPDKDGYNRIGIYNKGKMKNFSVHRLVAKAFIYNPNNYPVVNHINGIKTDNRVNNLEWCTIKHNTKESYRLGLQRPPHLGRFGKNHPASKQVYQIDKKTNQVIKKWDSFANIKRELKFKSVTSIIECCRNNRYKTAYGYIWRYVDDKGIPTS